MKSIILASQSPRRKQLLALAEVEFDVIVANTDESFPDDLPINEIPIYIAMQKAKAVMAQLVNKSDSPIVIAADTIVVIDNEIIGKPIDRAEALSHLKKLSGKTHHVITGVYIASANKMEQFSEVTEVSFHTLTEEQITFYVDKYQPYDKAGAYAIQEWIGVVGIQKINGDYYNVMGLPISRVLTSLEKFK